MSFADLRLAVELHRKGSFDDAALGAIAPSVPFGRDLD